MKLEDAQSVLREVHGRQYSWLVDWGLSTIREAIRTIEARVSASVADRERANDVRGKISKRR